MEVDIDNINIILENAIQVATGIFRQSGELSETQDELRRIVNELRDIADKLRSEFQGIGSEKCANALEEEATKYESVINKLSNINTSKFADGFDWRKLIT